MDQPRGDERQAGPGEPRDPGRRRRRLRDGDRVRLARHAGHPARRAARCSPARNRSPGEAVQAALEKAGVDVRIGAEAASAHRTDKNVVLELDRRQRGDRRGGARRHRPHAPHRRISGSRPSASPPATGSTVDDTMLVKGFDWLYATGDVNHRALLTHQGKYQARAAGDVIAARAKGEPVDDAPVGPARRDRRHRGRSAGDVHRPGGRVGGAHRRGGGEEGRLRHPGRRLRPVLDRGRERATPITTRVSARAIIDAEHEVLIGVTFVGPDVGEMLQAATIAVVGEVPLKRLWHAVPAYPTLNEVWLRFLETDGRGTA